MQASLHDNVKLKCYIQITISVKLNLRIKGETMERMKYLISTLNKASQAYYQEDTEIISNFEYDKLYDELLNLENESGIILSSSPTQKVGYQVLKSLNKVTHSTPLLSLNKTKDTNKLVSFLESNLGILSYKLDGLTVLVTYENGSFLQAVTRGNGTEGEDITHNALHFKNLPKFIPYKGKLLIRGEAIISYSDFEKINSTLPEGEKYRNPRNLCSGTVRQLDSKIPSKRYVHYFAFSLMECDKQFSLKSQGLEFLQNLGFTLVQYEISNKNNIIENVSHFKNQLQTIDLPIDGLVLTYDNIKYSNSLGTTSKFPHDSIAFKWEDQLKKTTLLNIEWNTSRTGLINPLAIFEEVELEGTIVKKASLHNLSIIEHLKLGIGDQIKVYKANMIIPQIAENLTCSGPELPPNNCNECKSIVKIISQNDVKTVYCTNPNCSAQRIKSITHYASRNAMNIEGLSEATVTKFVEKEIINNFSDIYEIGKHKHKIIEMEGFGEKSYLNIINSIEKSKTCNLSQFIYGLGIFKVGIALAKLLCNHYGNDLEKIKNATKEELIQIEGFGEIIANNILEYFINPSNIKITNKAFIYLKIKDTNVKNQSLNGLTFVITGNLENHKSRKELQDTIEKNGGKVTNSVTKKTSYLINNDKESVSSKNKNAKQLNIPIISEKEFINLFQIS